ncbi:hypothetical protein [Leptolyngbya sp. 7M]|uniref:hypothetical protein n=1 Tax=Leptolyngbya sp. 7M TaxID=2812896 RepID=UPI001B8BB8FF|nr:hypothetical protein [Leptolyngbya sp. 7M]QYO65349.1 hypothetical protein JVX88_00775 [Leptolyngbya sp. 7M]
MKNLNSFIFALLMFIPVILGCGSINPFSGGSSGSGNPTVADKTVDTVLGDQKIGIPECDEVMDMIDRELNNPDDGMIAKAAKATFLNKMKESIRNSVEQNNDNKTELAKTCGEFKRNLERFRSEQK